MRLYDFLKNNSANGRVPYHMPGHKRSAAFDYLGDSADIDYTETDGLDDLHSPCGVLREAMDAARDMYGSDEAFLLVNGSTGGVLASVYTVCHGKRPIIVARNAHKSVYNAAVLCGSSVHFIMPRLADDGFVLDVTPDTVKLALCECPNAAAVLVTSPTYDGVVSDIAGIAEVCHAHGVPLIVDAAHGAHLGFLDENVPSPVKCGADIVIMSLHKTLPSLTQTGLLHVSGGLVKSEDVARSLAIFETSSPSYVFMASIDGCLHEMKNHAMFEDWSKKIDRIRKTAEKCNGIRLRDPARDDGAYAFDKSKLILSCDGTDGAELSSVLRERYGIEPEMTSAGYVLLMTGAGDTDEMTDTLCDTLRSICVGAKLEKGDKTVYSSYITSSKCEMTMADALEAESEIIPLESSVGRTSAEFVMPYPPGIPLLAPGEIIGEEIIDAVHKSINVLTSRGRFAGDVRVVK